MSEHNYDIEERPLVPGRTYKVNKDGDLEASPDPSPVLASIRRSFRFLVVATVSVYLAIGGVAFYAYSSTAAVQQGVCNLRNDLERRVKSSERIVREQPQVLEEFKISKAQVVKEIKNQQRTLDALDTVNCD